MPRFTKETAAIASRLGNLARWSRKPDPEPEPPVAGIAEAIPDEYRAKRLARVRKQLDRIDDLMDEECDPQKLDRLASAQARLAEQERILRGEPLPGSRRPAPERRGSRGTGSQTPQQVAPCVPKPSVPVTPSTPPVQGQ